MRESTKKPLIIVGFVLLLLAIAVVYVGSNLNSIVKSAIERFGSQALGVSVSVASVELDIIEGKGTIRDFSVANPKGYSRSNALAFGELTLDFDYESKSVELIRAGTPEVNIEMKGSANNIEALLAGMGGGESPEAAQQADPVSLKIERIEVEAARAAVTSDTLDGSFEIEINKMVIRDLEGTGDEIASQILRQLLSQIRESITKAVEAAARDAVQEKAEELKEDAKQKLLDKLRK